MITHYPLLAARPHDVKHLPTLADACAGLMPADKGFIDPWEQQYLAAQQGVLVVTSQRRNMKAASPHAPVLLKACAKWRKKIEPVGSQLTEHFALAQIRVHDL